MRLQLWACVVLLSACLAPAFAGEREEAFFAAARDGDLAAVKRLHEAGVDVDARTRYGATALAYACDRGHLNIVEYLVEQGAEVNTTDEFYEFTPIGWAMFNGHVEIVELLLANGSDGAGEALVTGVRRNDAKLVAAALKAEGIGAEEVARASELAAGAGVAEEIRELIRKADVRPPAKKDDPPAEVAVEPEVLARYVGKYRNDEVGTDIEVRVEDGVLVVQPTDQPPLKLRALSESSFETVGTPRRKLTFSGRGGLIERAVAEQGNMNMQFIRVTTDEPAEVAGDAIEKPVPAGAVEIVRRPPSPWPSFRGRGAAGIADGQGAPVDWDLDSGENVLWKTPVPGIGNSSPIIWGDRVFVTTAVSSAGDDTFRTGLYGDVDSVEDVSEHQFKIYAVDRKSGKIAWERTAATAAPGAKRHLKSSQANSTPATDGARVVALFGSVGLLVAYDFAGNELWRTDIGVLNAGWFYDDSYEWGHASSPVIYRDLVIVQADVRKDSFIAAYRLKDGKQAWRTPREDIPSWGSPTILPGNGRDELIANGKTIRAYDPANGEELWHISPNSEVTVATPIVAHDLVFVTAGYPPVRPIYAIRPGGKGDLSLPEEADSSEAVAWSVSRGGTYIPTPIVYGDYLYTNANDGRLTCYAATTGERVYRARIGGGGSFTASPIAADGRLYFSNEDGEVIVVRAGAEYEELARNEMNDVIMSTPAISDGVLVVRTLHHLYGLGAD